jgi:hypothetical protein
VFVHAEAAVEERVRESGIPTVVVLLGAVWALLFVFVVACAA